MQIWIEPAMCNGDRLCEEMCPELFEIGKDGLAHLRFFGHIAVNNVQVQLSHVGSEGKIIVPSELEETVMELSNDCSGECIFIEK
jgi:ferredoxin